MMIGQVRGRGEKLSTQEKLYHILFTISQIPKKRERQNK